MPSKSLAYTNTKGHQLLMNLIIILVCGCAVNGFVPTTPCHRLFQYRRDPFMRQYFGIVRVPSPPPGLGLQLKVIMRLNAALPQGYSGHLSTLDPKGVIIRKIIRQEPIHYKVLFPLRSPLPELTYLIYNNFTLCIGKGFREQHTTFTRIELKHKLEWIGTQLNLIELPPIVTAGTTESPAIPVTAPPHNSIHSSLPDVHSEENRNVCGRLDAKYRGVARMHGGQDVPPGHWPWMAAIHAYNEGNLLYRCGGTLISSKIVITAAHCFFNGNKRKYQKDEIIVSLGQASIHMIHDDSTFSTGVSSYNLHPDFPQDLNRFYDADIAVIILKKLVPFSELIKPACLWSGDPDETLIVEKKGVVVGWGKDESGHLVTNSPRKVTVPIVSHIECRQSNAELAKLISSRTFCAGNRNGVGPCSGDSGGGLIIYENGTWQLRGIISVAVMHKITKACDLTEFIIYTDVAKFIDWIHEF